MQMRCFFLKVLARPRHWNSAVSQGAVASRVNCPLPKF